MSGLADKVYAVVKAVPEGMVVTYGDIAAATGNIKRSRVIGTILSCCTDNAVPCHRVVRKNGSMAKSFGIGGSAYQKFLLESEGVSFTADGRVDMKKHLHMIK